MISWSKPCFFGNEVKYVLDAVRSTWISDGPYINKFELRFSKIIGKKYAVTTSNGTTSLSLGLLGLGIGQGDEVIVPGFTFVAAGNVVLQLGAKPVYVDVDKDTWCIDPKLVEKAVNEKTKAIIVVHIYGNVCGMDQIINIARKNNLYVIEDTAEAVFSKYKGKFAGTFGNIGCFSFHATKTITMGEGGSVVTDNKTLAEKMRKIANHGMSPKRYWHDIIGYNYRLTNMQAALGCAQLEKLDVILENKIRVYNRYLKKLSNIENIAFQAIPKEVEPIIWAVAIKISPEKFKLSRDSLIRVLSKNGIETRPGFYPFSVMPFYKAPKCPIAESISKDIIVLPSYASLKDTQIDYISNSIKKLM